MNMTIEQRKDFLNVLWTLSLCLLAAAIVAMPELVFAEGEVTAQGALCKAYGEVKGVLKPIGLIAIVVVGVGALAGKVSWGMAALVALGIGVVFGAEALFSAISGQDSGCGGGGETAKLYLGLMLA